MTNTTAGNDRRSNTDELFMKIIIVLPNFRTDATQILRVFRAHVVNSPIWRAGSNGQCNTIWYTAVFKGGVYETRETVRAFREAEVRRVATLEGGADAA
jgi:hypothetical protein